MLRIGINYIYNDKNEGVTLVRTNIFALTVFELNRRWLVPLEGSIAEPFPDVSSMSQTFFPPLAVPEAFEDAEVGEREPAGHRPHRGPAVRQRRGRVSPDRGAL